MPPAALISLTASLTPLSKFVPDVAPVPDSSTNPTIRTGSCCCARDGSAAVIIQTATEKQKTLFMNSSIQRQVLHVSHECARLFEFETRTAWQQLLSISVAEIAQKVRLDVPRRKNSCSQPSHSLPAPKNSSSSFALSKPDIGPQSSS